MSTKKFGKMMWADFALESIHREQVDNKARVLRVVPVFVVDLSDPAALMKAISKAIDDEWRKSRANSSSLLAQAVVRHLGVPAKLLKK